MRGKPRLGPPHSLLAVHTPLHDKAVGIPSAHLRDILGPDLFQREAEHMAQEHHVPEHVPQLVLDLAGSSAWP
jgi:hypothetical protein